MVVHKNSYDTSIGDNRFDSEQQKVPTFKVHIFRLLFEDEGHQTSYLCGDKHLEQLLQQHSFGLDPPLKSYGYFNARPVENAVLTSTSGACRGASRPFDFPLAGGAIALQVRREARRGHCACGEPTKVNSHACYRSIKGSASKIEFRSRKLKSFLTL